MEAMGLLIRFATVLAALVFMLSGLKTQPFIALFTAALLAGGLTRMPPHQLTQALADGFGGMLGRIGLAVTFGCVLSQLLEKSGAVEELASWMIRMLGPKHDVLALGIVACAVSIPVFFGAAYVLLAPLCKSLSQITRKNIIYYICSMNAGLLLTCCCVPPAPGPLAIAGLFGIETGWYILYGMLVILPALLFICGWRSVCPVGGKRRKIPGTTHVKSPPDEQANKQRPGAVLSLVLILLPVLLMMTATLSGVFLRLDSMVYQVLSFLGNSSIAMFLSMLAAAFLLRKHITQPVMSCMRDGLQNCSIVIVLGIGGALANVISDSGIGTAICNSLLGIGMPLYLTIYLASGILRIALGSGTTAMIASAGIFAPVVYSTGLSPVLAALTIGAATIGFFIHTDASFWLACELFDVAPKQNIRAVTLPSTAASLLTFAAVCLLGRFAHMLPGLS